jgi:hypothetical protein
MRLLVAVIGLVAFFAIDGLALLGWRRLTAAGPVELRYTVAPDHVQIVSPLGTVRLEATAVDRVRTTPVSWVLRTTARSSVPIFRDAFTPQDAAAVDALLAGSGRR